MFMPKSFPLLAAEIVKIPDIISFDLDHKGNLIPKTEGASSLLAAIDYELLQPKSPLTSELILAAFAAAASTCARVSWMEEAPQRCYFIAWETPGYPRPEA